MNNVPPVQCNFIVRRPAQDSQWHYEPLYFQTWYGNTFLPLAYPPAAGDLIILQPHPESDGGPVYQVIERMWMPTQYGSMSWKYGTSMPEVGPSLDIIVEPAEGLYRNEATEESS
jgi:hypothetical protein